MGEMIRRNGMETWISLLHTVMQNRKEEQKMSRWMEERKRGTVQRAEEGDGRDREFVRRAFHEASEQQGMAGTQRFGGPLVSNRMAGRCWMA